MVDLMYKPTKKEIEEFEQKEMPKFFDDVLTSTGLENALVLAHMNVKKNGSPLDRELDPFSSALFKYIRTNV